MKPEIKTTKEILTIDMYEDIENEEWNSKKWMALDDVEYYYTKNTEIFKVLSETLPDKELIWVLVERLDLWYMSNRRK